MFPLATADVEVHQLDVEVDEESDDEVQLTFFGWQILLDRGGHVLQ